MLKLEHRLYKRTRINVKKMIKATTVYNGIKAPVFTKCPLVTKVFRKYEI